MNFADALERQVERARLLHEWPSSPTPHHAYGVIAEEFRELETELFKKHVDPVKALQECLDLAAVAQRCAEELLLPIINARQAAGLPIGGTARGGAR